MKTKEEIVKNWLPRYTGNRLEDFGKYILLTNFNQYLEFFCEINQNESHQLGSSYALCKCQRDYYDPLRDGERKCRN